MPTAPPVQLVPVGCMLHDDLFNSDKYMQYAASTAFQVQWMTLKAVKNITGGVVYHNSSAHQPVDQPTQIKMRAKRCVLVCKETKDGPLEVMMPEESSWYQYYVVNYLMYDAALPHGSG